MVYVCYKVLRASDSALMLTLCALQMLVLLLLLLLSVWPWLMLDSLSNTSVYFSSYKAGCVLVTYAGLLLLS